jgi:2-dehydropantoate 2-reductase
MTRIALIGPGAIGGTVGLALAQQGHDLLVCARQQFGELAVTRADTKERSAQPVRVVTSPSDAAPVDWVLLAVKSHQTASAADWLRATAGPGTKVAVLQNGVEHRTSVAPYLEPGNTVVPVVVILPAERTAPGEIVLYGRATLTVADDEAGRDFAALFAGSFVHAEVDADFASREWEKLASNAPAGAFSVLTMQTDPIARSAEVADLAARLVEECMAVGRAEGARFPDGFAQQVAAMFSQPSTRGNSMYYDRRDGNALEWDARNGVIQRLGRKHGIPTPVSDTIVPLLKAVSG